MNSDINSINLLKEINQQRQALLKKMSTNDEENTFILAKLQWLYERKAAVLQDLEAVDV